MKVFEKQQMHKNNYSNFTGLISTAGLMRCKKKMSGSLSTVLKETERSMEVISQNDANEHAKLKQSFTDLNWSP